MFFRLNFVNSATSFVFLLSIVSVLYPITSNQLTLTHQRHRLLKPPFSFLTNREVAFHVGKLPAGLGLLILLCFNLWFFMRLEPCQNLGIIRIAIDSLMIGFCGISSFRLLTVQTPLSNDSTGILISQIQTGYPLWPRG